METPSVIQSPTGQTSGSSRPLSPLLNKQKVVVAKLKKNNELKYRKLEKENIILAKQQDSWLNYGVMKLLL